MTRRRGRLAAAGAWVIAALVLAGCHASANVAIRVNADGQGRVAVGVTLDREAKLALAGAALKPGATTPDVPLSDLRANGWSITSWHAVAGGGAAIRMSKPFTGRAGLVSVLSDLDGRNGVFRQVQLERSRALLRDRDSVAVVADLTHLRTGISDDPALDARLRSAGIDVAALDSGLQSQLGTSFTLTVSVELPDGTRQTVRVAPGQQRAVAAASVTEHTGRVTALVVAAIAALVGLALLLVASLAARARRRPSSPPV